MKGMIKKDIFMIKNNYRSLIISLILFIFYSFVFEVNMSFFLPFMGLMICVSTLNYDEYNNWYTYASALPKGRINIVKSKYYVTIFMILFLSIVSVGINLILCNFKKGLVFDESISMLMGQLMAIIFMMSVLFPILFKYGSEKGRIAMVVLAIVVYGIVMLLSNVIKLNDLSNLIKFIDSYYLIIFFVGSIFFISVSYFISRRVYLKKEF